MDAIINNPFRVLGLPPSATDKEITKRTSDLIIYAEMGKKVHYETDFEFLGNVDRSTHKIKEAAKRLENKELKLFYSLMYFEIIDESDRKAMQLLEDKDYKSAISIWENSIFNNCPVILRGSKVATDVLKNDVFKDSIKSLYTIKSLFNIHLFPEFEITTHFDLDKKYPLIESFTELRELVKYQISCQFKFGIVTPQRNRIGFSLICKELSINNNLIIDSSGYFILEQENNEVAPSPVTISSKAFDTSFFKETNLLHIKKYDGLLEVWLNDNKLFTTENHNNYFAFRIQISGRQAFIIKSLRLEELEHSKVYSLDIELNNNTHTFVINLSLVYLLKLGIKDSSISEFFPYFSLIGNFFKQEYFKNYAKQIFEQNYEIDIPSFTDIFINEFYSEFKSRINLGGKHIEAIFYSAFRELSDEAEEKAKEILIGGRIYIFEETLKNTSAQRTSKSIGSKVLAENLIKSATSFFNWFYNFNLGNKNYSILSLQDKVSKELLECGISHYNNTISKSVQIANEAINIIKQSAELSRGVELRERIVKNLSIITKSHGLGNVVIDFKKIDSKNYFDSISFKGSKKTESISNKQHSVAAKKQEPVTTKKQSRKKVIPTVSNYKKSIFFGAIVILFIILITIINDLKNNSVKSPKIPSSQWSGNKLFNGESPYENYFGPSFFDYNSECWLLFRNGNSTDAIVCLENTSTGKTIRNEYIQAGTNFTMSNLPTGVYRVKVFYGKDWNPEKTLNNGLIKGAFETEFSFSISDNISDWITVKTTESYNGITYTTGEITLYKVSNGNMEQRKINSNEFFK